MFLTRLYRHVIENYSDLDDSIYESIYPTLRPIALKQTRRTRNDKENLIGIAFMVHHLI